MAAISDCPASGVAGDVGEPLTVQVKVVVPAEEFTVTLAMAKLLSYWVWVAPPIEICSPLENPVAVLSIVTVAVVPLSVMLAIVKLVLLTRGSLPSVV